MDSPIRGLLAELRRELEVLYDRRLEALFLFGSYARGQADRESDLDVLIVLTDFVSYAAEIGHTSEVIARLSLTYGVSISRVFVRERDWRSASTTFLRVVRQEAVPV